MKKREVPTDYVSALAPEIFAGELMKTTPDTPDATPGFKTSEFWVTQFSIGISSIITILTLWKIVPAEISSTLGAALTALASSIVTIVVALRYIKSRTEIKIKAIDDKQLAKDRSFNLNVQDTNDYYQKANLFLNLQDKGIVTAAQVKKELNIN